MTDHVKILNVGCTGKFKLLVNSAGWSIQLDTNEGEHFSHYVYGGLPSGVLANDLNTIHFHMPDWMWNQMMNTIEQLHIEMERGSIPSPYTVATA